MKESERHIAASRADHAGKAICGKKLNALDWTFLNIDHAFHAAEQGSRLQACPKCAARIRKVFSEDFQP